MHAGKERHSQSRRSRRTAGTSPPGLDPAHERALNDALRRSLGTPEYVRYGWIWLSPGVASLSTSEKLDILRAVANFESFSTESDPRGVHESGAVDVAGRNLLWFIQRSAPRTIRDADNAEARWRSITIMCREEC